MKTLIIASICLFLFSCGSDSPVTNNPVNPNPNSVTLLYPSSDTTVQQGSNDTANFKWSFTGTPTKFIWQSDTCTYNDPTFNSFAMENYSVYNPNNFNPFDTTINVPGSALRIAWRIKAIFDTDTIITPYRFIRRY